MSTTLDTQTMTATPWRDISDPRVAQDVDDLEAGLEVLGADIPIPTRVGPVSVTIDAHRAKRYAFSQDEYPERMYGTTGEAEYVSPAILGNDLLQLYNVDFSASKVRGLHAQEELWLHSPVRIGEVVTMTAEFTEVYERRGQAHVVMEAEARGEDGRVIARHRGIEMMSDNPGGLAGGSRSDANARTDSVTGDVDALARVLSPETAHTAGSGDVLPTRNLEVTFEQAAVYSRVGEYVFNVHNSLSEARSQGLRVPIVQGQQQVTFLASLMEQTFGRHWCATGYIKVKFLRPVEVFEPVELSGAVVDTAATEQGTLVRTHLWTRREDAGLSTVAWAECTIPDAG